MKALNVVLVFLVILSFALTGCGAPSSNDIETRQQNEAVTSIVENQPVVDLGGYSFERQIVNETYAARNTTISTFAYLKNLDGSFIEICASIGYPIPYSTQLSAPSKLANNTPGYLPSDTASVIPQSEPNGLYPPSDAAATLIQCVNSDGSVSPVYIEDNVLAFPFRIKAQYVIERLGEPSFTITPDEIRP